MGYRGQRDVKGGGRELVVTHPIGSNGICQCPLSPREGRGEAIWACLCTAKGNANSHITTVKPFQQMHVPNTEMKLH